MAPFCHSSPGQSVVSFPLFSYGHVTATALFPLPLGLSSMGKFPGRSGAEGRGRMERERKGARLRQKADSRARQRGETGPLNVHPTTKKCFWRVGVWRDPFSRGLNGFSLGLSQSPTQPLTPRERAVSACSLRCRSHPIPAPVPRHLRGRQGAQQNSLPSTGAWAPPRCLPPHSGVTDPCSGSCSPSVPRAGGKVHAIPFSTRAPHGGTHPEAMSTRDWAMARRCRWLRFRVPRLGREPLPPPTPGGLPEALAELRAGVLAACRRPP